MTTHEHRYQGQTLRHDHADVGPHGYYGHPEDFEPRDESGVVRDTDGRILRGPSLPCGCPLDADCNGYHPGAL